jgi:hypothetical protein
MTSAAIMQPTYLPWIGYFALIDRVDVFVFLDSVQFARRSWQQRNRIKAPTGEQMLTVPVLKKGRRDESVREVEIDPGSDFARKHRRSIESAYARAPFFAEYSPGLFAILDRPYTQLADLNIDLISWLSGAFGITTPCRRSSDMQVAGRRDALLVALCQELGADIYVSPPGSHDYLDESTAFADAGIFLQWHEYTHPEYPQTRPPFLSHMAAIDLLFNVGPDSLAIIRSGLRT